MVIGWTSSIPQPAQSLERYVPLYMNFKLQILALTILLTSNSIGQSLKADTFKTSSVDTSSIISWQCQAGSSVLSKDTYPLIIINGKIFKNCLLQNIFFDLDTTTISTIQVLNPKNDSVKLYGKAGKNGVIIITTKRPIEWVSAKQILKQNSKTILSSNKKALIKIDKAFLDTDQELYFQKNLIDNIYIANNTTQYYIDKQFNCIVTISVTKKSGT